MPYPALYEINTRLWLSRLPPVSGGRATLDDMPDADLDRLASDGFDWVWLLGVWQTGPAARKEALANPALCAQYREVLPDFRDSDVCGSCFAISGYTVHADFGGNAALARFRSRLSARGLRLMLDFIPNHTGLDHPWVRTHPEYYVHGTEAARQFEPWNYCSVETPGGPLILAHGRDPNFSGWQDTLQLNYADSAVADAMKSELLNIAALCDGVRCDMAMLLLPEVFERTWGVRPPPFWPGALRSVRASHPRFLLMAEVYWDLEAALQQQGFDYTYDKRLYDRLRSGQPRPVHDHFRADLEFQRKSARFLENHDERRAAAEFPLEMHRAAAVLTFLSPGLRFFHEGQLDGKKKRVPIQLCRGPDEPPDAAMRAFYDLLLSCVRDEAARNGEWRLLECVPAWDGNWTWICFIGFAWLLGDACRLLVTVNYAPNQSQCYVRVPFDTLRGQTVTLKDRLGPAVYERSGDELKERGLYLDVPAWGTHVFALSPKI